LNIIDLGTLPKSAENYVSFIEQVCDALEMDYGSYASVNPVTGAVVGYANYPDDWKSHYMTQNLLGSIQHYIRQA
jgi:hypothetical protein